MSTDKISDPVSQPTAAAHTSHFSSSLFAPAKLPKRSTSSTEKPASSHESARVTKTPSHEQAHGSGINTFTQHSPNIKQFIPLKVSMGGESDTPSLKATSFATTHNAQRGSTNVDNTAALAASSSFYSSMQVVQNAAHVRTSQGSPKRASNCSATSVSSSAARLRPSAVSRTSDTAAGNSRAAVYGLDRLDAKSGPFRPSLNQFARNSNASCLDADLDDHAIARAVAVTRSLPRELRDCARNLSAFSADCLLPAQVMAKLWKVDPEHAHKLISLLGDAGVVRHATLESGAMWCVPTRTFAAALRHVFREDSAIMHASVLAVYEDQPTFTSWDKVKDDGFIVLQLMRHLAATCRLDDIRSLLLSPTWLENKTHWHGPVAVSKDFYAAASANTDLASLCSLLMQAYSISLPAMTAMPHSGTLLAQILMRTAAITHLAPDSLDPVFCDWWQEKVKEQETAIVNNFRGLANNTFKPTPVHLLPLSTTLAQACGSTRLVIKSQQYTINAVALTETSEELVAACSDGKLRRFELQFGAKQEELSGMGLPLIDVQSCCRNRFATVSEQSPVVEVWCLTEGGVIMTLSGAADPVTRLLIHPRGTTALVGTEGGEVRMFSLVDGSCELVMASADHPVTVTAINVAWNVSTALSSPIAAVGHMTGGIVVWDLMGETEDLPICKLAGHKASVTGLAFFNQGECLISSSQDGSIIVWDLLSGTRLKVFLGHSAPVNGVVVEPTQELIALSWSDDCSAIVWSLESGQARTVLKGDTSYIVSACFVPPEQSDSGGSTGGPTRFQVVTSTGDGALLVWDAQTGELLQLLSGHSLAVKSVVSSGMNLVSVGEDKAVRLWNLRSKVVDMPIAHQTGISAIQAFGNSEALVTCGVSGNMQLWDCRAASLTDSGARECLNVTHAPMFTATSSNSRILASIAANSHTVLRDPVTLAVRHEMPPRLGTRVRSASFSGDCKLVAVVLQDSSITIWDVPRNDIMWQPQARGAMSAVDAHHDGVNACFLSEKGDILVTISKDCTARVWNVILRQASHVCTGHSSPIRCGWLSKDGSLLITGSEDSSARVWETSTGEATIVLAHNRGVTNVTGTDNKRRALTCTDSGAAWLWNVVDGECTAVLRVAEQTIMYSGIFLQDARLLVTRHSTASLAVWHVATGALVAFFACDSRVSHLACTPQGVLAAGTETGAVHFLQLPLRSGSRSFTGISDNHGLGGPKVVHARSVQRAQSSMEKPRIARAL